MSVSRLLWGGFFEHFDPGTSLGGFRRWIAELHLDYPLAGGRMLLDMLRCEGVPISAVFH